RHTVYIRQNGMVINNVTMREITMDRRRIDGPGNRSVSQERLYFRPKEKPVLIVIINERLLPKTITRQNELTGALVPYCARKHAVDLRKGPYPIPQVESQKHLSVRAGRKRVAFLLQLTLQFQVIVDLTIEHYADLSVGALHRLLTGR